MNNILLKALNERDKSFIGEYYVAVRTTKIFCDFGCPCKIPLEKNVTFYNNIVDIVSHGYRECKVCKPLSTKFQNEEVREYVQKLEQTVCPEKSYRKHAISSLEKLNLIKNDFLKQTNMSLGRYIRIKRSLFLLTKDIKNTTNQLSVSLIDTTLGIMVAIFTDKGLCLLDFLDRKALETELIKIKKHTNSCFIIKNIPASQELKRQLALYFEKKLSNFDVRLDMIGTDFQRKIWKILIDIPYGTLTTYLNQARTYGDTNAVRAIAGANGKNMIGIIIPCHRVIGSNGKLIGYGGGLSRKKYLIDLETNNEVERSSHNLKLKH